MCALNRYVALVVLSAQLPSLYAYYDDESVDQGQRGYEDGQEQGYGGFPRGGQRYNPQDLFNQFGQNGRRFPQQFQDQEEAEDSDSQTILKKLISQVKSLQSQLKTKAAEKDDLQEKVVKLAGKLKTEKAQKADLQSRLKSQSSATAKLQEQLKSHTADGDEQRNALQSNVNQLEADKQKLQTTVTELEAKLKSHSDDSDKSKTDLHAKIDTLEADKKNLTDTVTGLKAKLKSMSEEQSASKMAAGVKLNSLEVEKKKLADSVKELEGKLKAQAAELVEGDEPADQEAYNKADPQGKVKILETQKKRLSKTVTELRAKVSSLLAEASSKAADEFSTEKGLKNKLKSLEQNVSSKIAENRRLSDSAQQREQQLQAQIRSLQAETSSKAADAKNAESELAASLNSMKAEVANKTAENMNLSSQLNELRSNVERCEGDLSSQKSESQQLSDLVESQRSTISSMNEQINETSKLKAREADEFRTQISDTNAEKERIRDELRRQINDTRAEKERIQEELLTKNSRLQEEFLSLNGSFVSLKSKADWQTEQLDARLAEKSKLEEQVRSREGEISNLKTDVNEKSTAHSQLQQKHHDLVKQHTVLQAQHKQLEAQYEDPSVQHFLAAKAVKVYHDPGIEGAANKTFKYVVPTLRHRYGQGKYLLKEGEKVVYSKLNAYVGTEKTEPWLPAISGCLVYGTVVFPFLCTVCCLTRIVCKWRLILLFCHLDFLFTTLCAGIFAAYTGKEPLSAFAYHDGSVYLFTQLFFAAIFFMYGLLLLLAYSCSKAGTAEGCYRFTQILGAVPVACVYYTHVWTPAMLDEVPHMDQLVMKFAGGSDISTYAWIPYLPVSLLFLLLARLERLSWQAAGAATGKSQDQISVTIRDDIELANLSSIITDNMETTAKKE